MKLPFFANHTTFKKVKVVGFRIECESNNNKMYLIKTYNSEYFWVYDYETEIN